MRTGTRAILIATLLALVMSGTAEASKTSDRKLANRALPTVEDVPDGFSETPLPANLTSDTADACSDGITRANKIAEAAPSNAIGFQLDPAQGFANIFAGVAVLPKVGKAKKVLNAFQDEDSAAACVQETFATFLTEPGLTIEVVSAGPYSPELDDKGNEEVVKGGDEYAGISVNVNRTSGGPTQFFEAIAVFGRVGRAVFQLRFLTTGTVPQQEVQDLMQTVVTRLKGAK